MVLLAPYFMWTEAFSRATNVTVHRAWMSYIDIFKHLEKYNALLCATTVPWKVQLANSLGAAHAKLAAYYSKTDRPCGMLYNLACILDPTK